MRRPAVLAAAAFGLAAMAPSTVLAHSAAGPLGGLASGLVHPLLGLDHLLAMLGVGLWAARLGGAGHGRATSRATWRATSTAIWAVPLAFLAAMALGGAAAMSGLGLPAAELGIAGSVVLIGLLVAASSRFDRLVPTGAAAALVAAFAIFHGHAHGLEMPAAAQPLGFAGGFLLASAALLGLGAGLGLAAARLAQAGAARVAGAVMALAGLWLLAGA